METVNDDCKHVDCKWRGRFDSAPACMYMMITGKRRGCKISECDKYEPGKVKISSNIGGFWYDI